MRLYEDITQLIGHTPLVRLRTGIPANGPRAYVKLEFHNPTGSLKDRMAYHTIKKAMDCGHLKPGDTVIDNTSGNTGSAMAMVAQHFGLKAIVTTPEKTSREKVDLMKSYGAEVIVTPETVEHDDPLGFWAVARNMAREHGYFDLDQYDSQDNVEAHYLTTGPEIWEDTEGRITHVVAGIGTGGTFSGVAKYLKEQNPDLVAVAVDPEGSVFADYIRDRHKIVGHPYKVEGIGSDVVTLALHPDLVDEVITVSDEDSFNRARLIARAEGISAGGSSGSVACAMEQVAADLGEDSFVVGIFGDAGIRYLSKCYNDDWMRRHGYHSDTEVMEKK
ncbi:MAG: cysteine synthase family protein [candidate division Zixibacteria bacterium]|nr:cysteine synthase family protein [candidate division Zixibacteria bacterium]